MFLCVDREYYVVGGSLVSQELFGLPFIGKGNKVYVEFWCELIILVVNCDVLCKTREN